MPLPLLPRPPVEGPVHAAAEHGVLPGRAGREHITSEVMPVRPVRSAPTRAPIAPLHRGPGASATHAATSPNAALLIDFDNVTMGIRSDLQTELRNLLSSDIVKGKVAVQRAYADWRRYPQYIVPLSESSIDLIFAPAYGSSKKNATDIRLAVDAVELVFTRPEIGTYILLSGDSDFSSLVLKLKEYGKYVIGVGIRESSSDLLVQNCDEYYSYNALAGLVKTSEEELVKWDPWQLVVEAIGRMQRNGDVMRADRLKQVMQEIDPSFDEKNTGAAKFSRFCQDAAQRGLLKVTKLENGQLEVGPATGVAAPAAAAVRSADAAVAPATVADKPAEEREGREGRGRRGRRGGRGRDRDREDRPRSSGDAASGTPATSTETAAAPAAAVAPTAADLPPVDPSIGVSGERLSRDEAFDLVRRAVAEVATVDTAAPAETVRQRAFALLGRDSESLAERMFTRILRDAHDASVIDLRKRGQSYEASPAASAPTVTEQLNIAAAAHEAANPAPVVATTRSIVGRRAGGGRGKEIPADLLSVGVVELDTAPSAPAPAAPSVATPTVVAAEVTPAAPAKAPAQKGAKPKDGGKRSTAAKTPEAKPASAKPAPSKPAAAKPAAPAAKPAVAAKSAPAATAKPAAKKAPAAKKKPAKKA